MISPVPEALLRPLILTALEEDLAQGGDLTTLATINPSAEGVAHFNARTGGIAAGIGIAALAFEMVDPRCEAEIMTADGDAFETGDALLSVKGPVQALLTAERTALNFVTMLTGIATLTATYVDAVAGTGARIAATRKTLPGLRLVQKHAVRCGGGMAHRMSLADAVMIKDNHIAAAGGIAEAIEKARAFAGHTVKVEVEVDTLEQLKLALPAKPDIVLLDNMDTDTLREAVAVAKGQAILEASGGVTLKTVRAIAESGVDVISVGALTHSAAALDVGMELEV